MTSDEPIVNAASRYSVNETCTLLGISRKTLKKYTDSALIDCGFRKATLRKYYTGLAILKFWRASV